jgi:hypothetical protein
VNKVTQDAVPVPEEPTPDEFDPADTAQRVAAALRGKLWPAVTRGRLTVRSAEPVATRWPISLSLTVEGEYWPAPRVFLVELNWGSTFPGADPDHNADGLADNVMINLEECLETGFSGGVSELS